MKLIISLMVMAKNSNRMGNYLVGIVHREWDTNLVPAVGMEIEDSAWKKPRVLNGVTINPEENYYLTWVNEDVADTEELANQHIKMYLSHGWKRP